jgi:hypothetical protein
MGVAGYPQSMSASRRPDLPAAAPPATPQLPDIDSPPPEDVLNDVPSTAEIIGDAQTAAEIIGEQPGPEELLRGRR